MRIAITLALLVWSALAAAQKQAPDQIILDGGRGEPLLGLPLQSALDADPKLRERLKRQLSATACDEARRGYVATWEVRDDTLYLLRLDADPCGKGNNVPLSLLFPGSSAPVKASWYTGELRAARRASEVRYVKGGAVAGSATVERSTK
jgi:hypothetical protein